MGCPSSRPFEVGDFEGQLQSHGRVPEHSPVTTTAATLCFKEERGGKSRREGREVTEKLRVSLGRLVDIHRESALRLNGLENSQ